MLSKRDSSFFRYRVPQREMDRRGGDRSQPLHTPAMAGGLFSIDKDYFYEIGKRQFDEKFYGTGINTGFFQVPMTKAWIFGVGKILKCHLG